MLSRREYSVTLT